MGDEPIIQVGRRLWQAAERSRLAGAIRNLAETDGTALKEAVSKGAVVAGGTIQRDEVVLSEAVQKLARPGSTSVGEKLPPGVEFPEKPRVTETAPGKLPEIHQDIHNFAKVDDHVYRGGIPTDEDLASLKKQGVTQIVNLMESYGREGVLVAHEKEAAAKLGLKWVNFTMPWGKGPTSAMKEQFLAALTSPGEVSYVHCKLGRDRTGAFIASYRIDVGGFTETQAMDEMKTFGFEPQKYAYLAGFVHSVAEDAARAKLPAIPNPQ